MSAERRTKASGPRPVQATLRSWGAQSVRYVLFSSVFDARRSDELYMAAFEGSRPDSYQDATPGLPMVAAQAMGKGLLGQQSIFRFPSRVDLTLTPNAEIITPNPQTLPVLLDIDRCLERLSEAAIALHAGQGAVARIGVVLELVQAANDVSSANQVLSSVLPVKINLGNNPDFILQLNKQKASASRKSMTINRLMKFSVAQVQQLTMAAAHSFMTSAQVINSFHAAQVAFDVNSAPTSAPIPAGDVSKIIKEFTSELNNLRGA